MDSKIRELMHNLETSWYPHRLLSYTVRTSKDQDFVVRLATLVAQRAVGDKKYTHYLETIVDACRPEQRDMLSGLTTQTLIKVTKA